MTWLPINIIFSLIFILFLIWLYFLWKFFRPPLTPPYKGGGLEKTPLLSKEGQGVVPINLKSILEKFEKKYINSDKEIFYSKLSEILKYFLKQEKNIDISKMTYIEFSKINLDNKILNLLKNIYFKEYAKEIIDSEEIRKNLILEIKKLIK